MKRTVFSSLIVAALFAGGVAQAAVTNGTITSIDEAMNTVTLENGVAYDLGDSLNRDTGLGGYLPGDKVTIVWHMSGDKVMAQAISPDYASGVTGRIRAVDNENRTVTLENGAVYHFIKAGDDMVDLTGFRKGDDVAINAVRQGDREIGRSIASVFSAEVTGKVKSTDRSAMTLTLEDGTVYHIGSSSDIGLDGYRTGDRVTIIAYSVGGRHIARAVSPAG